MRWSVRVVVEINPEAAFALAVALAVALIAAGARMYWTLSLGVRACHPTSFLGCALAWVAPLHAAFPAIRWHSSMPCPAPLHF